MTIDAMKWWSARAARLPMLGLRVRVAVLACAGTVLACAPASIEEGAAEHASIGEGADEHAEAPAPPGWPLEVGDTIATTALRDLMHGFRPMTWAPRSDVMLNPDRYEPRIQASRYGIATFEPALMELPEDNHRGWVFACPPEGFVLPDGVEARTQDGALIIDLPPEIPCDPDKRFVPAEIYVGQVR